MANPVQIILNPENFNERREAGGGGSRRDFFAKRDTEFKLHKHHLISQLHAIASDLESAQWTDIGYVKVVLRREAWAKSHRPQNALFKPSVTPTVGGGDLGVMIIEASPSSLLSVADILRRAEDETRWKYDESQDRDVPFPTPIRSEAGAIERIELFGKSDRRDFSLRDAIEWLSDPATGGSYEVELFDTPPPHGTMDSLTDGRRRMFQSFRNGLNALKHGLTVERRTTPARSHALLTLRIHQSDAAPNIQLNPSRGFAGRRDITPFDPSEERHRNLLRFLDTHPLVRSVSLPGIVARSTGESVRILPVAPTLPQRKAGVSYPRIGIIDGGLGPTLSNWIMGLPLSCRPGAFARHINWRASTPSTGRGCRAGGSVTTRYGRNCTRWATTWRTFCAESSCRSDGRLVPDQHATQADQDRGPRLHLPTGGSGRNRPDGARHPCCHPPSSSATVIRVSALRTQTPRNRLDRSFRRPEQCPNNRGLTHPKPRDCASQSAIQSEKRLISRPRQTILPSNGRPLGECRLKTALRHPNPPKS